MKITSEFSPALHTDLYQLTMAYGYWKTGMQDREAVFHLFFRHHPFKGGFTIAAGLEIAIDLMESYRFEGEDLDYLASLRGNDGLPLFEGKFIDYLSALELRCDVDAIPEGTVVFPFEPLIRVQGPLLHCQLLETPLLNLINFQTLVATKAARIVLAAKGEPVIEFGLRRAQGLDGGLAATRAAFIGGCAGTSNVLAGKVFGIPVKGTHAHSWVMSFDSEPAAFQAWAQAMPNNCIFLVDTYNTLDGVRNAVEAGKELRRRGYEMVGVRLDSGDLAYLSVEARRILDEAGFRDAKILGSNELDEYIIGSIKEQGGAIGMWGVGTRLATSYEQPALDGIYKLSAIRSEGGRWEYKIKLSEQTIKITNPGFLQVRRFGPDSEFLADAILDERLKVDGDWVIVDPMDRTRRKKIPQGTAFNDLLVAVFRGGRRIYDLPPLAQIQDRARGQLQCFHEGVKRFIYPHTYPVGLEKSLFELKEELIIRARQASHRNSSGAF
ncbi:MAG: nicotinate phosphoribosyltransferase [bacterium]